MTILDLADGEVDQIYAYTRSGEVWLTVTILHVDLVEIEVDHILDLVESEVDQIYM